MNRRQLEVQRAHADDEKKVIQQLKQIYAQARKDCEAKSGRFPEGRTWKIYSLLSGRGSIRMR